MTTAYQLAYDQARADKKCGKSFIPDDAECHVGKGKSKASKAKRKSRPRSKAKAKAPVQQDTVTLPGDKKPKASGFKQAAIIALTATAGLAATGGLVAGGAAIALSTKEGQKAAIKFGVDQLKDINREYRKGFPESARLAEEAAKSVQVEDLTSEQHTVMFGLSGIGVGKAAQSAVSGEEMGQYLPYMSKYRDNPDIKVLTSPNMTPENMKKLEKSTDGGTAIQNVINLHHEFMVKDKRNPASVELASKMIAYGDKYPDRQLMMMGHSYGGTVVYEAQEILRQARPKWEKRVKSIAFGTYWLGGTQSFGKSITIGSQNDFYTSRFPTRDLEEFNDVKDHYFPEYMKSKKVRDRVREFIYEGVDEDKRYDALRLDKKCGRSYIPDDAECENGQSGKKGMSTSSKVQLGAAAGLMGVTAAAGAYSLAKNSRQKKKNSKALARATKEADAQKARIEKEEAEKAARRAAAGPVKSNMSEVLENVRQNIHENPEYAKELKDRHKAETFRLNSRKDSLSPCQLAYAQVRADKKCGKSYIPDDAECRVGKKEKSKTPQQPSAQPKKKGLTPLQGLGITAVVLGGGALATGIAAGGMGIAKDKAKSVSTERVRKTAQKIVDDIRATREKAQEVYEQAYAETKAQRNPDPGVGMGSGASRGAGTSNPRRGANPANNGLKSAHPEDYNTDSLSPYQLAYLQTRMDSKKCGKSYIPDDAECHVGKGKSKKRSMRKAAIANKTSRRKSAPKMAQRSQGKGISGGQALGLSAAILGGLAVAAGATAAGVAIATSGKGGSKPKGANSKTPSKGGASSNKELASEVLSGLVDGNEEVIKAVDEVKQQLREEKKSSPQSDVKQMSDDEFKQFLKGKKVERPDRIQDPTFAGENTGLSYLNYPSKKRIKSWMKDNPDFIDSNSQFKKFNDFLLSGEAGFEDFDDFATLVNVIGGHQDISPEAKRIKNDRVYADRIINQIEEGFKETLEPAAEYDKRVLSASAEAGKLFRDALSTYKAVENQGMSDKQNAVAESILFTNRMLMRHKQKFRKQLENRIFAAKSEGRTVDIGKILNQDSAYEISYLQTRMDSKKCGKGFIPDDWECHIGKGEGSKSKSGAKTAGKAIAKKNQEAKSSSSGSQSTSKPAPDNRAASVKMAAALGTAAGAAALGTAAVTTIKADVRNSAIPKSTPDLRRPPDGIPDAETMKVYDQFQPGMMIRKQFLQPGTEDIRRYHYGIYVGKSDEGVHEMVEVTMGEDLDRPIIVKNPMNRPIEEGGTEFEEVPEKELYNREGTQKFTPEQVVERATSIVGEHFTWNGFESNCESLSRAIKEGKAYSTQGDPVSNFTSTVSKIVGAVAASMDPTTGETKFNDYILDKSKLTAKDIEAKLNGTGDEAQQQRLFQQRRQKRLRQKREKERALATANTDALDPELEAAQAQQAQAAQGVQASPDQQQAEAVEPKIGVGPQQGMELVDSITKKLREYEFMFDGIDPQGAIMTGLIQAELMKVLLAAGAQVEGWDDEEMDASEGELEDDEGELEDDEGELEEEPVEEPVKEPESNSAITDYEEIAPGVNYKAPSKKEEKKDALDLYSSTYAKIRLDRNIFQRTGKTKSPLDRGPDGETPFEYLDEAEDALMLAYEQARGQGRELPPFDTVRQELLLMARGKLLSLQDQIKLFRVGMGLDEPSLMAPDFRSTFEARNAGWANVIEFDPQAAALGRKKYDASFNALNQIEGDENLSPKQLKYWSQFVYTERRSLQRQAKNYVKKNRIQAKGAGYRDQYRLTCKTPYEAAYLQTRADSRKKSLFKPKASPNEGKGVKCGKGYISPDKECESGKGSGAAQTKSFKSTAVAALALGATASAAGVSAGFVAAQSAEYRSDPVAYSQTLVSKKNTLFQKTGLRVAIPKVSDFFGKLTAGGAKKQKKQAALGIDAAMNINASILEKNPDDPGVKARESYSAKLLNDPNRQEDYLLAAAKFAERQQIPPYPEEMAAIYRYSDVNGYHEMNKTLRGDDENLRELIKDNRLRPNDKRTIDQLKAEAREDIKIATAGLERMPVFNEGKTYRGLTLPDELIDSIEEGGEWKEDGFTSTTKKASTRYPGNVVFVVNKSTTGRDISGFERYKNDEVLYPPGASFSVTSKRQVEKLGEKFWLIEMEEKTKQKKQSAAA